MRDCSPKRTQGNLLEPAIADLRRAGRELVRSRTELPVEFSDKCVCEASLLGSAFAGMPTLPNNMVDWIRQITLANLRERLYVTCVTLTSIDNLLLTAQCPDLALT